MVTHDLKVLKEHFKDQKRPPTFANISDLHQTYSRFKQEAQLLLGDRATRKHAKDS